MSLHVCRSLCVTFGFIVAAVGLLLGFYVFPKIIDQNIDETMKLVNGTDAYERWETLPLPLQFKVYFFNVTNFEAVQLGDKPKVKEIGPYVYDQLRHKFNITEEHDNLSYYQQQLFSFNEEASKSNREEDIITIANLPLMAISTIAEQRLSGPLNRAIPELFDHPKNVFLTRTVRDFLFDGIHIACDKKNQNGILKIVCNEIKKSAPAQLKELDDGRFKFSLLSFKNNTDDGLYNISNGVKDVNSLGEILAWKNASKLDVWKPNGTCNNIYGTDTTIFPPHRTHHSKVSVFQSDVCRSINLHYNSETEYKNIKGLRFVVENDMLMSGANLSSNECYCLGKTKGITGNDGCLLDGAMELWDCQKVPIVLTFPHFYLAHEKYQTSVDGLKPNRSLHETFVDLEPNSGTVLRGSKRVQFNIFYRHISGIDITTNLTDSLMPVFWIDEGVELNTENINLLNDSLFFPMKILEGVYWALIGLGLAMALIGVIWCTLFVHKPKNSF